MRANGKRSRIATSSIAQGALAIAIIIVSFFLLKGITNILNAFFVPLTLFVYSVNKKNSEIFLVYFAVFIICAIFFNLQIFFIIFYCVIAFLLKVLLKKNINLLLSATVLSIMSATSFWIAIMLTDYLFLTQMGFIMLRLFNGNFIVYALMLIVEGMLVGISQLFISRAIYIRLVKIISFKSVE